MNNTKTPDRLKASANYIQTDIKTCNKLFKIQKYKGQDSATFKMIPLDNVIEAVRNGFLTPDSKWNSSPSVLRMIKFALQYQDVAEFYFDGYVYYPHSGSVEVGVHTFRMKLLKPDLATELAKRYLRFCQTADKSSIYSSIWWAWWD